MREGFHHRRRTWRPSERQAWILDALVQGLTNDEIATQIGISADGVKWHVSELLGQTGLGNRYELAGWWQTSKTRSRFSFVPWTGAIRFGLAGAAAAAGLATVLLIGGLFAGEGSDGDPGVSVFSGADVGDQDAPPADDTDAQAPPSGGKPFFAFRQMDYVGVPTVRLSGGDLGKPVTVPPTEFNMACANATNNGLSCSAGVNRLNLPEPDAALPRYRWDFVYLGADYDVANDWYWYRGAKDTGQQYWYVPSDPPMVGPLPDYGWVELGQPVADVIERYIRLARAGEVSDEPSLAEGLRASFEHFEGEVAVLHLGWGGELQVLPRPEGLRLVELLADIETVIVVAEGENIGQRGFDTVPIELRMGDEVVSFFYLPPGGIANRPLVVTSRASLVSWQLASGKYAKGAFAGPERLTDFMTALGFPGGKLDNSIESQIVAPEPNRWRLIDRIEVWREGDEERLVLPPLDRQPCLEGCDLEYPGRSPDGEPLKVAVWPTGIQPFPDQVSPALFDYYPDDGGERGILVQTSCPAVGGGRCAQFTDFSFYPPSPIDVLLEEAAGQLK